MHGFEVAKAVGTSVSRIGPLVVTAFSCKLTFAVQVRTITVSADGVALATGKNITEMLAQSAMLYSWDI